MTPKQTAILRILDTATRPMTPNEIGYRMNRDPDPDVHLPSGHGKHWHGGTIAPGSMVGFMLGHLRRRGWLESARRPDGLSGTAYRITPDGREALRQ